MQGLTLIDLVVVTGIVVVMPLALRTLPARTWAGAGLAVALACTLDRGLLAAAFVGPWVAVATVAAMQLASAARAATGVETGGRAIAGGFGVIAATSMVASRAGFEGLGIYEPIIELTAVHYTFAGVGATVLALAVYGTRRSRVALAGLAITIAAPPIVAFGFFVKHPLPQVGGAVLMTAGVYCTAVLTLCTPGAGRVLRSVSALAVFVPMVLAISWAAANYWKLPALTIPQMARWHGLTNGFVFVIGGLIGWRRYARASAPLRSAVAS